MQNQQNPPNESADFFKEIIGDLYTKTDALPKPNDPAKVAEEVLAAINAFSTKSEGWSFDKLFMTIEEIDTMKDFKTHQQLYQFFDSCEEKCFSALCRLVSPTMAIVTFRKSKRKIGDMLTLYCKYGATKQDALDFLDGKGPFNRHPKIIVVAEESPCVTKKEIGELKNSISSKIDEAVEIFKKSAPAGARKNFMQKYGMHIFATFASLALIAIFLFAYRLKDVPKNISAMDAFAKKIAVKDSIANKNLSVQIDSAAGVMVGVTKKGVFMVRDSVHIADSVARKNFKVIRNRLSRYILVEFEKEKEAEEEKKSEEK